MKRLIKKISNLDPHESLPNLRKGAYRDAETIFADNKYLQSQLKFWNKTERIIYFKNGSLIEFVSFENEQSAKNGKRNYLFVKLFLQILSKTPL
jgi:phage terminase large subunit